MKGQLCPVCNGSGKVVPDIPVVRDGKVSTEKVQCHGCGGKGYILVPEDHYEPRYPRPRPWRRPYNSDEGWPEYQRWQC